MKVLLVSMPFASIQRPGLGTGLLQAGLRAAGNDCRTAHLNIVAADYFGRPAHDWLAQEAPYLTLVGDWVFTAALYGEDDPGGDYVADVLRGRWGLGDEELEHAEHARALAPGFIGWCLEQERWNEADLVGFSSFCGQTIASLALARELKTRYPHLRIAFGGGDWQGVMGQELATQFPFVDFVCTGEGDEVLPALVRSLDAGEARIDLPGLTTNAGTTSRAAVPVTRLDGLTFPDYADYLYALRASRTASRLRPSLIAETSRGCWWGAADPCRFCGLSGATRTYRAKSPERILRELRSLASTPGIESLELSDNVVPAHFLTEVLPALADDPLPVPMFLEMRALADEQTMRLLQASRVTIQPGIESLSDHVLSLMHKGSRALGNIRFLRLCREYGVKAYWNLLYGFPGETEADYLQMLDMLPSLRFLDAPLACARFSIDRFSPYFDEPAVHGLSGLRPLRAFRYIYPFSEDALTRIAYVFESDYEPEEGLAAAIAQVKAEVEDWRSVLEPGKLVVGSSRSGRVLTDTRPGALRYEWPLDPLDEALYFSCERVRSLDELADAGRALGLEDDAVCSEVSRRLHEFVQRRLMVCDGDRYLSLALFRGHE